MVKARHEEILLTWPRLSAQPQRRPLQKLIRLVLASHRLATMLAGGRAHETHVSRARHHRNSPSKPISLRGITLCATPDRGRPGRRLPSGGIACRLNHRLRLLHSSGMLRTRIKRLSQGDLPGLYVSQATQSSRCCANNGLTDCSPVGADISLNWHLMD